MKLIHKLSKSFLFICALTAISEAKYNSAVITLTMPIGARQAALGEGGIALHEDAYSTYWNPAGLAFGPVADEWQLSLAAPQGEKFTTMSTKSRQGFLSSVEVWAGSDKGLWLYRNGQWSQSFVKPLEDNQKLSGVVRRFVGSDEKLDSVVQVVRELNGIHKKEEDKDLVEVKLPWSLVIQSKITQVFYDEKGDRLWVGTEKGLYRFDGQGWKNFETDLGAQKITAITVQGANIWVGTENGLFRYREGKWVQKGKPLPSQKINALAWSEKNRQLWVSLEGAGVASLTMADKEGESDKWRVYNSEEDGIIDNSVQSIAADEMGHIWISHKQGVSHFTQFKWEQIRFDHNEVYKVAAKNKQVWIATQKGAWLHKPTYTQGADGVAIIDQGGTQKGDWVHYHQGTGLASQVVGDVSPESQDVWFVTNAGIERFAQAKPSVGVFYEQLLPQLQLPDLYHVGLVSTIPIHEWGTIGAFLNYVSFGQATSSEDGVTQRRINSSEMVAGLSYATKLTQEQSVGMNFKILYSDLSSGAGSENQAKTASYAVDAAYLVKNIGFRHLDFAAVLANMGPDVYYVDKSNSDPIPLTWRFGFAYEAIKTGDHRLVFTTDYQRESISENDEGTVDPFYTSMWRSWIKPNVKTGSKAMHSFNQGISSLGFDYSYLNTVALRMGYMYDDTGERYEMNVGFGLIVSDILQTDISIIKTLGASSVRDGQKRFSLLFKF